MKHINQVIIEGTVAEIGAIPSKPYIGQFITMCVDADEELYVKVYIRPGLRRTPFALGQVIRVVGRLSPLAGDTALLCVDADHIEEDKDEE